MSDSVRQWKQAVVGIAVESPDASATEAARSWARENELDYFEINLDTGTSVEDMLTEVVRSARLLTEKPPELFEEIYAQAHAKGRRASSAPRSSEGGEATDRSSPRSGCTVM